MLSYSNFNKHLTAVRETFAVLRRAQDISRSDQGRAMQRANAWLQQHNVVAQLLRSNLHQRQYVDQVSTRSAGSLLSVDAYTAFAVQFSIKPVMAVPPYCRQ